MADELESMDQEVERESTPKQTLVDKIPGVETAKEFVADVTEETPEPVDHTAEQSARAEAWARKAYANESVERENFKQAPGFFQAAAWNVVDDGLTANAYRYISDLTTADATDEEYQEVVKNMDSLMINIPEEYRDEIQNAGNLVAATNMRQRIATTLSHQEEMEKMGAISNLGAGFLGFVADPINFVPGALLWKAGNSAMKVGNLGTRLSAKLAANPKAAAAVNVSSIAALGGSEEIIRTAPRLMSDPTYEFEDYIANAKMGVVFGGAFSAGFMALKGMSSGTRKAISDKMNSVEAQAAKYDMEVTARTYGEMVKDVVKTTRTKGAKEAFNEFDKSAKYHDAKERATQTVDNKMKDISVKNITRDIRKVIEEGNEADLTNHVSASVDTVVNSVRKTIPKEHLEEFDGLVSSFKESFDVAELAKDLDQATKDGVPIGKQIQDASSRINKMLNDTDDFIHKPEIAKMFGKEKFHCEM